MSYSLLTHLYPHIKGSQEDTRCRCLLTNFAVESVTNAMG